MIIWLDFCLFICMPKSINGIARQEAELKLMKIEAILREEASTALNDLVPIIVPLSHLSKKLRQQVVYQEKQRIYRCIYKRQFTDIKYANKVIKESVKYINRRRELINSLDLAYIAFFSLH